MNIAPAKRISIAALLIALLSLPLTARGSEDPRAGSSISVRTDNGVLSTFELEPFRPDPTGALLRSVVFPGWGQFYNRSYVKAGVVAVGEGLLIYYLGKNWIKAADSETAFRNTFSDYSQGSFLPLDSRLDHRDTNYWDAQRSRSFDTWRKYVDERNKYMWMLAGSVLLSMFDAYVDAHLMPFDAEMNEDLRTGASRGVVLQLTYHF